MKTTSRLLNAAWTAAAVAVTTFALTTPARSQVILGGDFQLYKPGTTNVTATYTGFVPWPSSIPNPTSPTSLTVNGGSATFSDSTTGTTVDLLGWTKPQGGGDLVNNGIGGSSALNMFAAWGGFPRPIVETTGSLVTVAAGQTITISTMVGGPSTGPKSGSFFFSLYAGATEITPTSVVNQTLPLNEGFQMISRTYGATALAAYIGQTTKIRLAVPDANTIGNRIIFDDVTLTTSVADTTPPTLTSFVDNKSGGPIFVNEPVSYTVTFSEPMSAMTVDVTDFANTSATAMTVNSVTPTANPAVFLVGVTPTAAGTLQLQIVAGAILTDIEGVALVTTSALPDDTSLDVNSQTPTTTVLVSSGSPTTYGQNVTFTATVSPTPTGGTIQFRDGGNSLGTPVMVNTSTGVATYSTTALGAATHQITADYSGHLQFAASTAAPIPQQVGQAPLTVRAQNAVRAPNTANPNPLAYQITGLKNGENLGTSGVTGAPALTTDAVLSSSAGNYTITCAQGSLAATNYSFTLVNGILTVKELANTFSVNFYVGPDWPYGGLNPSNPDFQSQIDNLKMAPGMPAGVGDWFTDGWTNCLVPWAPGGPLAPVTLTSSTGSNATFTFKKCRNGWTYSGAPRTTLIGDGNGNMMDAHVNSTLDGNYLFDMEVTNIPYTVYDVIFYLGASQAQFGDGTGVIKFNGGADRAFKLKPGAFDGTFTEMVDATTLGNYIVFRGVTGSSFTTQTWGTGSNGYNHVGPFGFQIREASGFATWAVANNATGQTADQDHDNDGVENGIEYFMGETGSSFTAMPGLDATNTVTWPMSPTYKGTYEVQTSPDLGTWTNLDPRPLPSGGNLSYLLPTGMGKRFVRLLVTPTP